MSDLKVPEGLLSRWQRIFGDELKDFLEAIKTPLVPSIRVNTLKVRVEEMISLFSQRGIDCRKIPWCPYGFWIYGCEEENIGNFWEHFVGLIYVQEPSSMIPAEILNPESKDKVLDIAAAPGSKTTHMAQIMENRGAIVANDINPKRLKALTNNIERLGVVNVCVTCMDGRRFGKILPSSFDKVLVDAPCSAEGTIRKSYKAIYNWHEWAYKKLSETQKALLISAFKATKPGGLILYSTCTFSPEENEAVVSYILEHYDAETEGIDIPGIEVSEPILSWNGEDFHPDVKRCIRIYPHKNEVGGFFVAKIRKLSF